MSKALAYLFIFPIRIYQLLLSPILSGVFGMKCRFEPSCSHYMANAIKEWGPFRGILLGVKRLARCHPWGGFGDDPVPPNPEKNH